MTGVDPGQPVTISAVQLARLFRPMMPSLVSEIVATIHGQIDRYGQSTTGRRHQLIEFAVSSAINEFLENLENPTMTGRRADELFRRMGHGEAMDGHPLEAMQTAFRLATQESWEYLRSFAIENQLSAAALANLGDALFAHIDHLAEQARLGHVGALKALDRDQGVATSRLLEGLLRGDGTAELEHQASLAGWELPNEVVVLSVQTQRNADALSLDDLTPWCLVGSDPTGRVLVTARDCSDEVLTRLDKEPLVKAIAISWPVAITEARSAYRWATRAVRLALRGVIPSERVIRCEDHRTQLWLHAEPTLRQQLCQELLPPLLAETPNSREILSETLLVWLETRDSAPAIAAKLGVHPQTVRYRWKRINELFGEDLHDPDFVTTMTMLLKASVPLWKAGDQSDFERFRADEEE
ncbi:helix-turn-helix domain-containing protein [Nocardioides sp. Root140]|uniref:PucR family transcriptional regulator n=1 Tax=Nocardioides sp. Root140 TaxID=1736460 RepID=UPI00138F92FF|nr:helix-turn-helix domain-containing protein [Nocardioides sp. Root140]